MDYIKFSAGCFHIVTVIKEVDMIGVMIDHLVVRIVIYLTEIYIYKL